MQPLHVHLCLLGLYSQNKCSRLLQSINKLPPFHSLTLGTEDCINCLCFLASVALWPDGTSPIAKEQVGCLNPGFHPDEWGGGDLA